MPVLEYIYPESCDESRIDKSRRSIVQLVSFHILYAKLCVAGLYIAHDLSIWLLS